MESERERHGMERKRERWRERERDGELHDHSLAACSLGEEWRTNGGRSKTITERCGAVVCPPGTCHGPVHLNEE